MNANDYEDLAQAQANQHGRAFYIVAWQLPGKVTHDYSVEDSKGYRPHNSVKRRDVIVRIVQPEKVRA